MSTMAKIKTLSALPKSRWDDYPDDGPLYFCDVCSWRCYPDEMKPGIPMVCPHDGNPLQETTKAENVAWRKEKYGHPC